MSRIDIKGNEMFISRLYHKPVATYNGRFLGLIENIFVDTGSGKLISMLVKPSEELDLSSFQMDSEGYITIPFDMVSGVGDMVILDVTI